VKINIVSGYFDPIHDGHIEYFQNAKAGCDKLIVILNNDLQTSMKKGKPFMTENVRKKIVESIKYVDELILSIDNDRSVCKTLEKIRELYPKDELYFVNGGDRGVSNIPEYSLKDKINLKFSDGAGEKINSSSSYYKKEQFKKH
jgi:cytidyltransferase-like protein